MDAAKMEDQLRSVGIKIIRQDDKIKVQVGKHKAELMPLEDKTQTYPFFAFAQWVTETAVAILAEKQGKQVVLSTENKQAAKSALESIGFEANEKTTDNVIAQIHENMFGGK